ncbi:hypothetical protein SVAN01_07200 [Stagonosporopsis vannaccii]|nr:hypothetical protein SVAN01_07200 [Stagonosporopsis vannaccii]
MKVLQMAALFGGVAYAAQPLVGRADGITTVVVYATVTETVMSCPGASSHGLQPLQSGAVSSSSTFATIPPIATKTLSDSVPTSFPPGDSSVAYVPPVDSSALPKDPISSIRISVSLVLPKPSLPNTNTESSLTSFSPNASGLSSAYTPPGQTSGSDTVIVPQPSPSRSVSLTASLTDSIPTSFPPDVPASGSSIHYIPPMSSTAPEPVFSEPVIRTSNEIGPTSGGIPSSGDEQVSTPSITATDAVPTSGTVSSGGSSSGTYTPSVFSTTDVVPISGSESSTGPISLTSGSATTSHPPAASSITATAAVPTSGYSGSSVPPSSGNSSPFPPGNTATDAVPTSRVSESSSPSTASPAGPTGTNTDSVPTSFDSIATDSLSSGYPVPETTTRPNQGTSDTSLHYPPESLTTVSGTNAVVISASSDLVHPEPPLSTGTTVINGTTSTTRITSRLTLASTSYVTVPVPTSRLTDTATDSGPTSLGTGYLPSGTGSPYPSGVNGTIVPPSPSYIEVPVNTAQAIAVGQGPIAAIVIALAFVLFT